MFLFFTTHMMSICEKNKLTNKFMEFHHFMKKAEDTAEDFFKLIGIYRSSRSQMFLKIGVLKTFTTFTGKPALQSLFNNITPKQLFSVNIAKFLRLVFCIEIASGACF